jgi:aminoglycoside phosphotransferase (APT) family kinase protein
LIEWDRGPYSHKREYMHALAEVEVGDTQHLQNATPPDDDDGDQVFEYDNDLAEDAPDIIRAMREIQDIIPSLFTSSSTTFALCHHDLSTSNIIVDPTTYQITGIVDWESVGVIPNSRIQSS